LHLLHFYPSSPSLILSGPEKRFLFPFSC
jgi:hypothetical protein